MSKIIGINELDDLNNLGNKLENNFQLNYGNTLRGLPWPIVQGQFGIKLRGMVRVVHPARTLLDFAIFGESWKILFIVRDFLKFF